MSIRQIVRETGFSTGSVSKYCSNLRLNNKNVPTLQSNTAGALANKIKWDKLKKAVTESAKKQWTKRKNDCNFLSLIAFYWAEGTKRGGSQQFTLTNSDPGIISSCAKSLKLLNFCDLYMYVRIYEGQSTEQAKIEWESKVEVPVKNIYIAKMRKPHKLYSKFGVASLYHKKSFKLYHSIMAWIECWRNELGLVESWQL